jgi:hypothetical protein
MAGTSEEDLRIAAELLCEGESRGFGTFGDDQSRLAEVWGLSSPRIREGLEATRPVKSACARLISWVQIRSEPEIVDLEAEEMRTVLAALDLVDFDPDTGPVAPSKGIRSPCSSSLGST